MRVGDERRLRLLLALLLAAAGAWLVAVGPREVKDTVGYLAASPFRTAGYPLFLALLSPLPGSTPWAAAIAQIVLQTVAVGWLALRLRGLLRLDAVATLAAAGWLLVPPLLFGTASDILSEGLAYPILLFACGHLLAALVRRAPAPLVAHAALLALGILVRPQLLFVVPVTVLVVLEIGRGRSGMRTAAPLLAALLVAVLAADLVDRTWHHVRHGTFSAVPFTGLQLSVGALYVSEPEDAAALPADERELFASLRRAADDRGLLHASNPHPGSVASFGEHFEAVYDEIAWGVVVAAFADSLGRDGGRGWRAMDRRLVGLSLRLLAARPVRAARLYLANVAHGVGSRYLLVLVGLAAVGIALGLRGDALALAMAAAILLHLANVGFVALVQAVRLRYLVSTDALHLALLAAFVWHTLCYRRSGTAGGAGDPAPAVASSIR